MIARLRSTGVDPERLDEYDAFASTRSEPMFRRHAGFRGVLFISESLTERLVVTLWADARAADALESSTDYIDTVAEIEASGFLRPPQQVGRCRVDGLSLADELRLSDRS